MFEKLGFFLAKHWICNKNGLLKLFQKFCILTVLKDTNDKLKAWVIRHTDPTLSTFPCHYQLRHGAPGFMDFPQSSARVRLLSI